MTVQVYPRHARQARICMRGSREFFTKHGLDWNDFVTKGLPGDVLIATGDPIAARAVRAAENEAKGV